MNQYNNQGKGHKVAATQETTAQNAEIQSYFNSISQEELNAVCEALSTIYSCQGGLQFNPSYFKNYLEMTNKFINSARMGEDKRNMVLNAIGFLCGALLANKSKYEKWEHIAQRYYPEDLEDITVGEDGEFADKEELTQAVCYEIECILADWDTTYETYDPEDWPEAEDLIDDYLNILRYHDCEVPEWTFKGRDERHEWYNA